MKLYADFTGDHYKKTMVKNFEQSVEVDNVGKVEVVSCMDIYTTHRIKDLAKLVSLFPV